MLKTGPDMPPAIPTPKRERFQVPAQPQKIIGIASKSL
jgi:hypothetical protein